MLLLVPDFDLYHVHADTVAICSNILFSWVTCAICHTVLQIVAAVVVYVNHNPPIFLVYCCDIVKSKEI